MPARKVILATGEIYHLYNRGLRGNVFKDKRSANRFIQIMSYYLQPFPSVKFSYFQKQPEKYPIDLKKKLVEVYAFCLMPSHFHLLLKQIEAKGIQKYIHRIAGSHAQYLKTRNSQRGPVFEGKFKAVRIQTREQFIHLTRYIHLNPVTEYLVNDPLEYKYSSYRYYLNKDKSSLVNKEDAMENFTISSYTKFVLDRIRYQRKLNKIKHLLLE